MPREIDDNEIVTQYGNLGSRVVFRRRPHPESSTPSAMSVTIGRRAPSEMAVLVTRRPDPRVDVVRIASVRALRTAGFAVRHDPTDENPDHALVEWTGEWEDTVSGSFDSCFGEHDE